RCAWRASSPKLSVPIILARGSAARWPLRTGTCGAWRHRTSRFGQTNPPLRRRAAEARGASRDGYASQIPPSYLTGAALWRSLTDTFSGGITRIFFGMWRGGHDTAMTPLLIQNSSPWLVENWLSYDWPVYLAFLLGRRWRASWSPRRSPLRRTISTLG